MKSVLVIAPQFIGDSILTIPFLRELKKHVGRCEIDVVSKNSGCYVFKKCPYVRNVYDWKNLNITTLRKNNYDKAYILKRSLSAAVLAFRLGIKDTIGFGGQFREFLLKKVVKYDRFENRHEIEHFFDVLREDYVEINDKNLEFYVNDDALKSVEKYLSPRKKVLVVACSSTYVKDWSVENFANIVDFLDENGYDSYFIGLEKEREYCDNIIELTKSLTATNLCGKISLDDSVALISKMDLIFGVDSGFCHVGSAFGKKVVTLFGPTSVAQWQPLNSVVISLNLPCSPCVSPKKCKKNYECMKKITYQKVVDELKKVL